MFDNFLKNTLLFFSVSQFVFCLGEKYVLEEVNNSRQIARNMLENSKNECYVEIEMQNDDALISGVSFCNHFFGNVLKSKLEDVGVTMMICSPKDMENEKKILSILNHSTVDINYKFILIKNKNGNLLFVK